MAKINKKFYCCSNTVLLLLTLFSYSMMVVVSKCTFEDDIDKSKLICYANQIREGRPSMGNDNNVEVLQEQSDKEDLEETINADGTIMRSPAIKENDYIELKSNFLYYFNIGISAPIVDKDMPLLLTLEGFNKDDLIDGTIEISIRNSKKQNLFLPLEITDNEDNIKADQKQKDIYLSSGSNIYTNLRHTSSTKNDKEQMKVRREIVKDIHEDIPENTNTETITLNEKSSPIKLRTLQPASEYIFMEYVTTRYSQETVLLKFESNSPDTDIKLNYLAVEFETDLKTR